MDPQLLWDVIYETLRSVIKTWINLLLPERTALLRAPLIEHVVLEDWLLAQHPA